MMRLAVNYSPQAARLLREGGLHFDLFKCRSNPDLIELASGYNEVYVHLPLRAGSGAMDRVDWDFVEDLLIATETRYVNLYLAPHAPDFTGLDLETDDSCWRERLTAAMVADVDIVARYFGKDHVIVENAPWDTTIGYAVPRPVIEPEVINAVVEHTGVGFILDLAHARISARYLGWDDQHYIARLPVKHLREMHVTGITYEETLAAWRDHYPMQPEDWQLVEWSLKQINDGAWSMPEIVALEYGGVTPRLKWRSEPEVLAVEIARLNTLLHRHPLKLTV